MINTVNERLQKHRIISSETECYGWNGAKDARGFARLLYNNKSVGAHRVTWIAAYGEIPKNYYVYHSCNNKECTNLKHLFISSKHPLILRSKNEETNRIGRSRLSLDIPRRIHQALKAISSKYNQTMTKYIVRRFIEIIKYEKNLKD